MVFQFVKPFWRRVAVYSVERLIEIGWKESFKLMKEAVQSGRCINCNAQIEYVFYDYRIEGKCPLCGQHYLMQINDLTPSRLFPLWNKYKRIRQKIEDPVEKKGIPCWKITVNDGRSRVIAVQHVKVGEGEEVAWKEL